MDVTTNASAPAAATAKPKLAGGPLQIVVVPNSDFVVQLTPAAKPLVEKPANAAAQRARVVQFRVSRAVLQENSSFFQTILGSRPNLADITFENKGGGFGHALEIWLRAIHNGPHTLPNNLKATRMERAWVAIGVGEQFGFAPNHIDKIKPWFLECYQYALDNGGLTPFVACCLAFPCSVFDHAEGFMKLTKYLAYHTNGSLFTNNPSSFHHLNHDARVLDGPLTAARAHIQSILETELTFPIDKLHRATCPCRKETAFDYEDALRALDCWPIDRAMQQYPIGEIIDELEKFEFTPKTIKCSSGICAHDFKNSVNIAIRRAKYAFDGLCLDCMERSQIDHVDGQTRQTFLEKNTPFKGCWDIDCRFGHGRASWYYSWMGPSSVRRDILNKYREEKKAMDVAKGSHRTRRGIRPSKDSNIPTTRVASMPLKSQAPARTPIAQNNTSDKANNAQDSGYDHDVDDEDEFFDAEDASLGGHTVTDDIEELDHEAVN
ncbi:hypothetical protein BU23DRAFT_139582 [Bimuria novae-zelandiae CBS 107.79]|uniref:BTB domain-containing protein n=1 Tax=Bimuria novae-zelandiae CBS 107.79 TaxID=1447943 RepID=A0A6A5VA44_9PLEO|nr:hypothetical protein BU23DRAFT_139582 [Bimuria novae-zelandiae CBS 107.79]